jgi:hypothetical protein
VFPYPVTRDRDRTRRLDLTHEPKPYVYGLVGSTAADVVVTTPRNSPPPTSHSRTTSDARPDSVIALIGPSSPGLTTTVASAPSTVGSVYSARARGGEVGRQTSHSSVSQWPRGAAPPMDYYGPSSSGSASSATPASSWLPLQPIKPSVAPAPTRFIRGAVPSSNSAKAPPAVPEPEPERQLGRPEKKPTRDLSSSGRDVFLHTDWGRIQAPDPSPSASGSGRSKHPPQPRVTTPDMNDAPPAYVA